MKTLSLLLLLCLSLNTTFCQDCYFLQELSGTNFSGSLGNPDSRFLGSWQGKAVIVVKNSIEGNHLWISDGTSNGTWMIQEPEPLIARCLDFLATPEYFYLISRSGDTWTGFEYHLWQYDGENTTKLLTSEYFLGELSAANGVGYFVSYEETHKVHKIIAPSETTEMIFDVGLEQQPGDRSTNLGTLNNELIIIAHSSADIANLYRVDTETNVSMEIHEIAGQYSDEFPPCITEGNGKIFFFYRSGLQINLYASDGTSEGTIVLKNGLICSPESSGIGSSQILFANDNLYMAAGNAAYGIELFLSDGSVEGTKLLKDIAPGNEDSNPSRLTAIGDKVYFLAETTAIDPFDDPEQEIWSTDGTEEGTVRPFYYEFNGREYGDWLTAYDGRLVFVAGSTIGNQIFASDGTAEGTEILTSEGSEGEWISFDPIKLFALDDKLLFGAHVPGLSGHQLWVYDSSIPLSENVKSDKYPFLVYPNPAKDHLQISSNASDQFDRLTLVDLLGRRVMEKSMIAGSELDVSALSSGVYFAVLSKEGKPVWSARLMVE